MNGLAEYISLALEQFYEAALALGGPGLLLIALLDSSFLSVPEGNDLLIVVLSTGQSWERMAYLVLMTIAGSAMGCSLLYSVGRRGGAFVNRPPRREKLKRVEATYRKWGLWTILVPAVLPPPTPFKVFVLSAGVFKVPFLQFLLAILVGRSIRYFLWGILAVLYGEWAKEMMRGSLHTVGVVIFVLIIMMAATYVVWKALKKRSQRGLI